ncbi:P-loop containing nucleoside triphosphate hydrolase protein [Suillus clintonianus]|uniref:P-loop containing nucleoside triphosphate hydrolase protein n=1 Tax=Suillus clintonianus TaxID=1904413 RepID=UPI001B8734F2|nr:P-loop containing nucleoside triphosphate hydrolase protein [Suillus clintonianus]KAG2123566.1 P-loop containing nucleoside triphosphate hydrolase protein [Suillus clintonianus]
MSSSDYGFDDELDSTILNEWDTIEAAHRPPLRSPPKPKPPPPAAKVPKPLDEEDSFFDLSLEIDDAELQRLDTFIDAVYKGNAKPVAGPSNHARPSSKNTVQRTLFGDVAKPTASSSTQSPTKRSSHQRAKSSPRKPFGRQAPQTKQWDHTVFAKSGWKKPKTVKGKGRSDGDEDDEEHVEFEQFPAPFVSIGPPPSMKLKVDMLEAKHWIYPLNQPKRDYQFNIVRHCLFDNTLVALPTGLGKTFIAGVVMLNFYRWFPKGKVVFVAPTKPLVAQQIDACHRTCGIPGCDAVELTGNNPRMYRSRMWEDKRVFYMTPQTLINDLTTENCDARDIVLMVIDEAHKGTGDYAYAQVIRFLMAKNPHHRVLALTATPGSTPEAIQSIVDSLHISRIEIRDENSIDLREYMHKKEIKQHIIKMTDDVLKAQELLKEVMITILKPLSSRGVIEVVDPVKMHPYRAQATMQRIGAQRNSPHKWAFSSLSKLAALARAMGYLMEASIGMCHNCLLEISAEKEDDSGKKKGSTTSGLRKDKNFMALLSELEVQKVRPGGYGMHPKMETLKMLLLQYFGARMGEGEETRAMVFVTYRECVDEIVHILDEESPLLKVTRFIGQGTDKQGRKGFAQKEQLEVLKKFKAGEFNVLVSTSIGEEGLDIGEVDMIVCYDAQKTPIRMLQRVGRTGRKRDGYVHVLLSEIREELNWDKAKDTYGELQKCIVRGDQLELYGDVPRLLPEHAKPQVLEKRMEIEEYVRQEHASRKKSAVVNDDDSSPKGKKRKRNDDFARNIPQGASAGFVSVKDLLIKGADTKTRKKAKTKVFDPTAAEDDSTDMELEANLMDMRRTASTPADPSTKKKNKLRTTRTMDPSKKRQPATSRRKGKEKEKEPLTTSQFSRKGDDDDDDIEIEQGISLTAREAIARKTPSPKKKRPVLPRYRSSSPDAPVLVRDCSNSPLKPSATQSLSCHLIEDDALLLSSSEAENPSAPSILSSSPMIYDVDDVIELSSSQPTPQTDPEAADSSSMSCGPRNCPINKRYRRNGRSPEGFPDRSPSLPPSSDGGTGNTQSMAWLLGSDEEPDIQIMSSPPIAPQQERRPRVDGLFDDESVVDGRHLSPGALLMPPPPLPCRGTIQSPAHSSDHDIPDASFAVRPAGRFSKSRAVAAEPNSPALDMPPLSQRRLKRKDTDIVSWESSPAPKRSKRKSFVPLRHNPWLDGEAAHSGDEASEGSSHSEDDVESDSDRQFIKDIANTQISPSYDQSLAYQRGLLTQALPGGPAFVNRPVRRGIYARGESAKRRAGVSSSPVREDDLADEYAIGSFVVDDDEDII